MNFIRVLVYMNPLITSKGGDFLFWKDSGFIYTKHLIKSLPSSFRFYWVIPHKIKKRSERNWFYEANQNIELVPYPYTTDIHKNRYEFNSERLNKFFSKDVDIDLIINNQPELTTALKNWRMNKRDDPLIFSFYHWLCCKDSMKFASDIPNYFFRQYDGVLHSDVVFFHTDHAIDLFRNEIMNYFGHFTGDWSTKEVDYFHPPPTKFGTKPFKLPEEKIILFNHRLNNTTQWKEVIEACKRVYEKRQDFVLWMTDDSDMSRTAVQLEDGSSYYATDQPFIIVKSIPFESFGYLIEKSHFAICNHRGYSTWNMAVLDCFYNGCYSLVPHDGVYKEMFHFSSSVKPPRFFHKFDNLEYHIKKLLNTSKNILDKRAKIVVENAEAFNASQDHILRHINRLMSKDCKRKHRKNYNEVKSYIEEKKICTKKEWQQKFWTFPANRNFRLIRWHLLQDGIKDDTSLNESTYYIGKTKKPKIVKRNQGSFL